MKKTIWYGVKDNEARFSHDENSLASQGITNPQSFEVAGEVTGLTLIGEQQPGSQVGSQAQPTS